jgi:hypothetical protein
LDLTACRAIDSLGTEALQALARHGPVWVFAGGGSIAGLLDLLDLPPGVRVMTRGAGIRGGPRAP